MWDNNATVVNFAMTAEEASHIFDLAGAYTTITTSMVNVAVTITSTTASIHSHTTPPTGNDGSSSTLSSSSPTTSDTCPSTPKANLGLILGVSLGVPLLAVSTVLLWMIVKQKYQQSGIDTPPGR
jgi:hypothetical protein